MFSYQGKMRKELRTLFSALVMAVAVVASGSAQAQVSFYQGQGPILGLSSTYTAWGIDTGSGPWSFTTTVLTDNGTIYLPQVSTPGDTLYHVGGNVIPVGPSSSAGMTAFINSATLKVWDAAAISYPTGGNTYQITERWDYLSGILAPGVYNGVMVGAPITVGTFGSASDPAQVRLWHSDNLPFLNTLPNGNWKYTHTWTNVSNSADTITGTVNFTVNAVPEPETYAMMLAGLGLMGFMARRRKQKLAA